MQNLSLEKFCRVEFSPKIFEAMVKKYYFILFTIKVNFSNYILLYLMPKNLFITHKVVFFYMYMILTENVFVLTGCYDYDHLNNN